MTLTEKLELYMRSKELSGLDISTAKSSDILAGYYLHIGMPRTESFFAWLSNVQSGAIPAFASVTRAIRKARERNPRWQKPESVIEEEVEYVKSVVGY